MNLKQNCKRLKKEKLYLENWKSIIILTKKKHVAYLATNIPNTAV